MNDIDDRVYEYICECFVKDGYTPTNREIGTACNLNHPMEIQRSLNRLEEGGFITREPHKIRNIRVVDPGVKPVVLPPPIEDEMEMLETILENLKRYRREKAGQS